MSIEESHGNGRTPMRIWRSQRSHFRFIAHSSASGTSSASSLIQFFSVVLDVRHLPRIMVLIQYASAWENVVSMENLMSIENRMRMGEPHAHMGESTESLTRVIAHYSASGSASAL